METRCKVDKVPGKIVRVKAPSKLVELSSKLVKPIFHVDMPRYDEKEQFIHYVWDQGVSFCYFSMEFAEQSIREVLAE